MSQATEGVLSGFKNQIFQVGAVRCSPRVQGGTGKQKLIQKPLQGGSGARTRLAGGSTLVSPGGRALEDPNGPGPAGSPPCPLPSTPNASWTHTQVLMAGHSSSRGRGSAADLP